MLNDNCMQIRTWKYIYIFLLLVFACIFLAILQFPDQNLHIVACNVGQGDAILITYGSTQILTDGGPDKSVLDCLGKYMPFWDREIELIVSTHSDSDHATGLISVIEAYQVDKIVINPLNPGTPVYKALENVVGGRGVDVINPTAGMELGLGLIHLDIVNPEQSLFMGLEKLNSESTLSKYTISGEANKYSVAYVLRFKKFKAFMTGDIPPDIADSLANSWQEESVDYIKIPHHGSINGLTQNLLEKTVPKVAVISVGKNPWGLPKSEILNLLSEHGVKVYRTDKNGDIELITDGEKYWTN